MDDTSPSLPAPGQNFAGTTFSVKFITPFDSRQLRRQFNLKWRWAGQASLHFQQGTLVIQGHRARTLLWSVPQEVSVPLGEIFNLSVTDRLVRCEVRNQAGLSRLLQFRAATAADAKGIAALLPEDKTEQFARTTAEQQHFDAALAGIGTRAIVTPSLVGLNVLVFVATVVSGVSPWAPQGPEMIPWGTNYGPRTLDGEWWRLLTSMFLHFGVLHLLFNMWALWSVGRLVERLYGSRSFLALYVVAGLAGSISTLLWNPDINSAGASGAIFGVLGGLLAFMLNPKTRLPASVVTAQRNSALIFIAYNLFNGFTHAGIDNACHIGGLLGGFLIGWVLARPLEADVRQQELRHLSLPLAGAVVALIALSWPLTHPSPLKLAEHNFTVDLNWFSTQESQAITRMNDLQKAAANKEISAQTFAADREREVVPLWNAMLERISGAPLPDDSKFAPLKLSMVRYLTARRDATVQRDQGIMSGNGTTIAAAGTLEGQAASYAADASSMMKKLY